MKEALYRQTLQSIEAMVEGESDRISVMSTIACELFQAFAVFNWAGFYRCVDEHTLKVGPYQGTHGCLSIDIASGVCGKCVREASVQLENDVTRLEHHIACSVDTRAEIVVPVFGPGGEVTAVLDVDAREADVFDELDAAYLAKICALIPAT